MTRRRAFGLIFGSLIVVFVIGSIVTVWAVRSQLIRDIDDQLAVEMANSIQFYDEIPLEQVEDLGDFSATERATLILARTGEELRYVPAGDRSDPVPRPRLEASRVVGSDGESFIVGSDGPNYRVLTGELADGRAIALAQPLDNLRDTLGSLGAVLLATLAGIIALQGLIFWWLLRLSLRPYDDLIDTAQAIAGGDLDRRAVTTSSASELEKLTTSLNTMLDRIQESFRAKAAAEARVKQFAADASHELRTPVTTIAGYSELYLSGAATDSEATTKQMTRINSEANRMGRLVNDLLVLARLDQGEGLDFAAVDVAAIVADAVGDRRVVDPDQDVTLSGVDEATAGAGVRVVGDRDALHQVFINLLANATLHAPGAPVHVSVASDVGAAVVTVRDEGPGMAAETAEHVFDRFFRADTARTTMSQSSGLGLSIVTSIVDGHGGSIDVDTAPGSGTVFTVRLPTVPPSGAAPVPG